MAINYHKTINLPDIEKSGWLVKPIQVRGKLSRPFQPHFSQRRGEDPTLCGLLVTEGLAILNEN
jgi:hypothetical protein